MSDHTLSAHRADNGRWLVTCSCGWVGVKARKQATALDVGQRDHVDRQFPPCPTPGKRRFKSRDDAEKRGLGQFWRTSGKGKTMPHRVYRCRCGAWHTSSKPSLRGLGCG